MGRTIVPRKKHRLKRSDGVVCAVVRFPAIGPVETACRNFFFNHERKGFFKWTTRPVTCLRCLAA